MDKTICFLGLGNMGQGISKNLILKGGLRKPLVLWNRTHEVALRHGQSFSQASCIAVSSLSEAVAQGDIIWSCLSNEAAVLEVYQTVLQHNIENKVLIDSSTVTPAATDSICARVTEAGGKFIAMPVFGEPTMAQEGTLVCVPSGEAEVVDAIRPFMIGVIARSVVDLSGQTAGKASLLKLIGNTFIVNTMQMVAEGHTFAEKSGLGCAPVHQMIEALFPGPAKIYSERMMSGGYYMEKPMVNLTLARKVADQVSQVAAGCGTELPAYQLAAERLKQANKEEGPENDISSIYGAVRVENGLRFRNLR